MSQIGLIRYGVVPEVARCELRDDATLQRGEQLVAETHRGPMLATLLEVIRPSSEPGASPPSAGFQMLRVATPDDQRQHAQLRDRCSETCDAWDARIQQWQLDLQLLDCEYTLDGEKLILYVLNERGPECTRLAIQAAAAGFGLIEVQPVDAAGIVSQPLMDSGGGCGTGGCGCSH
ncbi:MAG: hypothetical protein KDA58_08620 [Planctomycetaceae bacterium]|nr:hypothetical protein [Planctomycetaceae bacterium]